jgi:hypothetical protein
MTGADASVVSGRRRRNRPDVRTGKPVAHKITVSQHSSANVTVLSLLVLYYLIASYGMRISHDAHLQRPHLLSMIKRLCRVVAITPTAQVPCRKTCKELLHMRFANDTDIHNRLANAQRVVDIYPLTLFISRLQWPCLARSGADDVVIEE